MRIDFHRNFDKRFSKLAKKHKDQFKLRLIEFTKNSYHQALNNHALKGKYQGYRSINVTGDLRAIFKLHSKNHIEFVDIGTHGQLYG